MKPAACFIIPVNIEDRDHFFSQFKTCMHFVRHTGAPPLGCQNGNYFSIAVLTLPIDVTSIRLRLIQIRLRNGIIADFIRAFPGL